MYVNILGWARLGLELCVYPIMENTHHAGKGKEQYWKVNAGWGGALEKGGGVS